MTETLERHLTPPTPTQQPNDWIFGELAWFERKDGRLDEGAMVGHLPRSLVDVYVERAVSHARTVEVDNGVWVATVAGLDGVLADSDSREAAITELRDVILGWVAVKHQVGAEIPAIDGVDLNPQQ